MDYRNQTFQGTSFANSKFHEVQMSNIEIEDACLLGAKILDANYDGMTIDGILLNGLFLGHHFRLQALTYADPKLLKKHRAAVEKLREDDSFVSGGKQLVDYMDRAGSFFCEFVGERTFVFHCVVPGGAVNWKLSLDADGNLTDAPAK